MASFDISPPISLDDAVSGSGVSAYDVLNGKGNSINNTRGNVNYRRLVSANKVCTQCEATLPCLDANANICLVLVR